MQKLKDILCYFGFHNFKLLCHFRFAGYSKRKVFYSCTNCKKFIEKDYKLGKRKDI